jgi:hypothetical protein
LGGQIAKQQFEMDWLLDDVGENQGLIMKVVMNLILII